MLRKLLLIIICFVLTYDAIASIDEKQKLIAFYQHYIEWLKSDEHRDILELEDSQCQALALINKIDGLAKNFGYSDAYELFQVEEKYKYDDDIRVFIEKIKESRKTQSEQEEQTQPENIEEIRDRIVEYYNKLLEWTESQDYKNYILLNDWYSLERRYQTMELTNARLLGFRNQDELKEKELFFIDDLLIQLLKEKVKSKITYKY